MYLSIDAAKRYIFYSSIKFQKLTIQLFYQTYDPLIYFELSIIILIYHMQYLYFDARNIDIDFPKIGNQSFKE